MELLLYIWDKLGFVMSEQYLGNPNLKKANTAVEFTEEQIIEFVKCKEDPVYFARQLY